MDLWCDRRRLLSNRNLYDDGGGRASPVVTTGRRTISCTGAAVEAEIGNQHQLPPPRDAGRSVALEVIACTT